MDDLMLHLYQISTGEVVVENFPLIFPVLSREELKISQEKACFIVPGELTVKVD